MLKSIPNAIVLAIVTYAVGLSLAKVFGKRLGYSIDSNQVRLHVQYCPKVESINYSR